MIMAAFCILNMLLDTGAMDKIRELIISISDDRRKHITIVAFGFGGFLEGCAGAGTPAAVAAPCLMGLGVSPMYAVLASLISNGIWSSWGAAGLTPKFAELNDDVLFGEVWSRTDKLGLRDRSLVTITSLISQGITDNSLTYHLQSAKNNGITRTEIAEIITHIGFYAG